MKPKLESFINNGGCIGSKSATLMRILQGRMNMMIGINLLTISAGHIVSLAGLLGRALIWFAFFVNACIGTAMHCGLCLC